MCIIRIYSNYKIKDMEEPFDLNQDKVRIKCKSLALIFDSNIDKEEIYKHYYKILKGPNDKAISMFVSWDTIHHSTPNTTILIDFGAIVDRSGINKFKYKRIIPVIRKITNNNFATILNDLNNQFPEKKGDLKFSFDADGNEGSKVSDINEDSMIPVDLSFTPSNMSICPMCKNELYSYQLSNDGVICNICKASRKKAKPEKKLDNEQTQSLKDRVEKLELEVEKFKATIGFLHNCLSSILNQKVNTETFINVYNNAPDMGIVFINLGFVENYISRPVFHLKNKNIPTSNKLLIIIEKVNDKNKFESEMAERYSPDIFTEMKPLKLEFLPISDNLLLETSYNNIKKHLDTNKHVEREIKYDVNLIQYDNIFLIHKDYLSTVMFSF